jgi:hypothetical protein
MAQLAQSGGGSAPPLGTEQSSSRSLRRGAIHRRVQKLSHRQGGALSL